MLKKEIFSRICGHFFVPQIDLFASSLNAQVDNYVSWFPEPGVSQHNAFTFSWQHLKPYVFPPFNLIGKVMNKILKDQVENAILIFPFWKAQSWFPLVLENISSFPVRLPRHKDLLTLPHDSTIHPLHKSIQMIAVTVSGKSCVKTDFKMKFQVSLQLRGAKGRKNNITVLGESGVFGIYCGEEIQFGRLKLRF